MLKNGEIKIDDTEMEYIAFGSGKKTLVMIPGVGDGFKTVKGSAFPFSLLYRKFAKRFTVYVFSRKNKMHDNYSNKDMAIDLSKAFEELNLKNVNLLGISQGGMICQWFAILYPELVEKLILCVTLSRPSTEVKSVIGSWLTWAEQKDYEKIFIDTNEKSYTEKKLKSSRPMYKMLAKLTAPKSFDRFIIEANACINQNSYSELDKIKCPTFVIGGKQDKIVGAQSSIDIAEKIANSKLLMYEAYGHGLYEEAKDFTDQVLDFFN